MFRLTALLILLWTGAALAAPSRYALETGASEISFSFDLQGTEIRGHVPVRQADVVIDFDDLSKTQVTVVFDMTLASTGVIFATDAMKSAEVLATAQYPTATFRSTRVVRVGDGARLTGDLTLRGVTRPVTLNASIFRARGSDPGDLSRLLLLFTGTISRAAHGVTGYPRLVADPVGIRAVTAVARQN